MVKTRFMKVSILVFCFVAILFTHTYGVGDLPLIDFRKADSVAALYPKHSLHDLKALSNKLTQPLETVEEKFRAIYKWVCENIEYDYPMHRENQEKRAKLKSPGEREAWKIKVGMRAIKTLLSKQRTVCTGYAYLVKELAYYAGISCVVVDGYGRTAQSNIRGTGNVNHSWNAVQLRGVWYLCDPTWSSGAYDVQGAHYVKNFTDSYFLADPSLFVRNHYPLDTAWMLSEHKPTLHEFLNGPLIYSDAFTYAISQPSPETFDILVEKREKVSFQFGSGGDKTFKKIQLAISNGPIKKVTPEFSQDASGLYTLNHVFNVKGTHIVHILLDDRYVVSYSVKVK